jgi:rfaE bifunctional protein kinase chain/domain
MGQLEEVLDKFKEKSILVMGDIILDKFTWGSVKRVNPEQPAAPLVKVKENKYSLGGAANVANNISSLEAGCCLFGIIGNENYGEMVKTLCDKEGIALAFFYSKEPTLVKQRVMAHGQQLCRLDFGEGELKMPPLETQSKILGSLERELGKRKYDFMILSDYNKGLFSKDFCREVISISQNRGVPIHVDPKPENIGYFRNCTIVSPNKGEAERITGLEYRNDESVLTRMSEILAEKTNAKYIVITCGKEGVFAYDVEKQRSLTIGTKAREVSNVTGAGDTFAAILPLALSSGISLFDSVRLANYGAGIVVEKVGTATPKIDEIKKRIIEDGNV